MIPAREQIEELAEEHGLEIFAFDVLVHGTNHHFDNVKDYIRGVIATQQEEPEGDYSLELVRDPDNEVDSYAIKVFGKWECRSSRGRKHIGFVPRKLAFKIGLHIDDDDPLHALIASINGDADNGFDILFHIAVPEGTSF